MTNPTVMYIITPKTIELKPVPTRHTKSVVDHWETLGKHDIKGSIKGVVAPTCAEALQILENEVKQYLKSTEAIQSGNARFSDFRVRYNRAEPDDKGRFWSSGGTGAYVLQPSDE